MTHVVYLERPLSVWSTSDHPMIPSLSFTRTAAFCNSPSLDSPGCQAENDNGRPLLSFVHIPSFLSSLIPSHVGNPGASP